MGKNKKRKPPTTSDDLEYIFINPNTREQTEEMYKNMIIYMLKEKYNKKSI